MKKIIVGSSIVALFVGALGLAYYWNKVKEITIFDISFDDEDDLEDF